MWFYRPNMKSKFTLLILFIAALFAGLFLTLRGFPKFSSTLFWIYIAGALVAVIVMICLSDRKDLEGPSVLWFFLSNELGLILLVALWPVLVPLVIASILAGKSKGRGHKSLDESKGNS